MENFLEDRAEVEINPDDQYHFLRHNALFRSRDYHVTVPGVFPIGLWGVRYSLFIIYSCRYFKKQTDQPGSSG